MLLYKSIDKKCDKSYLNKPTAYRLYVLLHNTISLKDGAENIPNSILQFSLSRLFSENLDSLYFLFYVFIFKQTSSYLEVFFLTINTAANIITAINISIV